MPARRPTRPVPVASLTVPAVSDEETKRAILPIVEAIRDLQRRVALLSQDAGGGVAVSSSDLITVLNPPQITFATSLATWNIGPLGDTPITVIRYTVDSGSRNVPGLAGGTDRKIVIMMNTESSPSTDTAFFLHLSGVAPPADQFNNATGANQSGGALGCVIYYYDGARSLWQHIGGTQ